MLRPIVTPATFVAVLLLFGGGPVTAHNERPASPGLPHPPNTRVPGWTPRLPEASGRGLTPPAGELPPASTPSHPAPGSSKTPRLPPTVPRTPDADVYGGWAAWWFLNRSRYFDLSRTRIGGPGVSERTPSSGSRPVGPMDPEGRARKRLVDALLAAAKERDVDLVSSAVIALGKSGDVRALPVLRDLAEGRDAPLAVRESAILSLGMLGPHGGAVRDELTELLGDPKTSTRERAFAALALGLSGDPGALPHLVRATAEKSRSREVPAMALLGLGLLGDDLVVPNLSRYLEAWRKRVLKDEILATCAVAALAQSGSRTALPDLRELARDRSKIVRRQAVLSLGSLIGREDKEDLNLLAGLLATDRDDLVRGYAALSLGQAGHPAVLPRLLTAYREGTTVLAPFAAISLGLLVRHADSPELAEQVAPFLRKEFQKRRNPDLMASLAISLGLMKDRSAVSPIRKRFGKGAAAELRGHLAMALGLIGDPAAVPDLREALSERADDLFQREVALSLALFGDAGAVKLLTRALKKEKSQYRRGSAAIAMGYLVRPSAAEPLRKLLTNRREPEPTRALAAMALGSVLERGWPPVLDPIGYHISPMLAVDSLAQVLSIF